MNKKLKKLTLKGLAKVDVKTKLHSPIITRGK